MTDTLSQSAKSFEDIKNKYEHLIQKIFDELEAHKDEQSKLKEQLLTVIEDNNRITSKIDNIQLMPSFETTGEHEKLSNDAISNLKQQVHHLKEERSTIQHLWKTSQETIANLETEIQNYRNQLFKPSAFTEIKEKYCKAIKALEHIIASQKNEISVQNSTIRDLTTDKNRISNRIKELEAVILEQENKLSESQKLEKTNSELKLKLKAVLHSNSELEMSKTLAKSVIDERFIREKNALEKLQEALLIAETAVAEKEEALKREIIVKEECEALATTIGQVMEEAARKVEQNVEGLKEQYEKKENILLQQHQEAIARLEKQIQETRAVEGRCQFLEQRLKEVLKENSKLDNNLQVASEAIIEMELKLEATENLLKADKRSDRLLEEREQQIRQYIENNHQLKERWKCTVEDVTKQFGNEIQRLQKENAKLKAEIQAERLVHKLGY